MQGERAALLQRPQGFQQILLPLAGDVVVDVVADHGVEGPVREVEVGCVALPESRVADTLRLRVVLTQRLVEGGVLRTPAVDADDGRLRIALRHGDGQRAAAAAHVYKDAVFDTNVKDSLRHISAQNIKKSRAFTVLPVIPAEL